MCYVKTFSLLSPCILHDELFISFFSLFFLSIILGLRVICGKIKILLSIVAGSPTYLSIYLYMIIYFIHFTGENLLLLSFFTFFLRYKILLRCLSPEVEKQLVKRKNEITITSFKNMPDRYETPPNKRTPLESVNTKNSGIDVVRKLEALHISKTTKSIESPNLCFKAAKHSKIVKKFDKHVCKLIWAHLAHIEKPSVPHIEIEMKFGTITDKTTHRRIACGNKPSTIQNSNGRLVSKVSKKTFLRFQELFCPKPESTIKNTFSAVEQIQTYTKDSVYNAKNRSKAEKLTSWRCSEDLKSKESERSYIKKIRVKDFLIHYPHSSLDAKISISLEIPQCDTSAPFQHSPILRRFKNRSSYSFGNGIPLHLDLTEVATEKSNSSHRSTTYEVEVEMDTIFKKAILTNDEEKFGEYMNRFLHTGDLIRKAAKRENIVRT